MVRDLFRGYNKLIRPVQNMTQKVEVAFGLAFIQLINVNEKNQIMKSNVWLRLVSYNNNGTTEFSQEHCIWLLIMSMNKSFVLFVSNGKGCFTENENPFFVPFPAF